jgi:vesicular inhibitory amino acid transporter
MFGVNVSDEVSSLRFEAVLYLRCIQISIDLLRTPGYNPTLNQVLLWMLVISPL